MDIDVAKLRNGERVECPICKNGELLPENNANPATASHFKCSNCKEKLIFHFRLNLNKTV